MGDLFTRLTRFFDLSKTVAVTVPGLVAAVALALMMRPVKPADDIAVHVDATECQFRQTALRRPAKLSPQEHRQVALDNQTALESSRRKLQDCILLRSSQLGKEESDIADLKHDIQLRTKERDVFEKKYLGYVESRGPLRNEFEGGMRMRTNGIMAARKQIVDLELVAKRRQLEIDRMKADLKVVDERLADPGRLRPALGFTDYFDGLTAKVLAFGLLAMVLGYTLDPINRGLYGALFDRPIVLNALNWLRSGRFEVIR